MGKEDESDSLYQTVNEDGEINASDVLAETAEKGIDGSVAPLLLIHSHLDRFTDRFSSAAANPEVEFSLGEFGAIQALTQKDFQLDQSFSDAGSEVSLQFRLTRSEPAQIEHPLLNDDKDVPVVLRQDGVIVLSSRVRVSQDDQSILAMEIAGDIPVSLDFRALLGSEDLIVEMQNAGTIGSSLYRISPAAVDADFLTALDQFLAFENDHFLSLLDSGDVEPLAPPLLVEQTIQTEPVSAEILTFDLAQRPRQKKLKLYYQDQECSFEDDHPVCRIGRRMPADVQVRSRFVSREHATVILEKRQFSLRDHSSNGTYIRPEGKPTIMLHHAAQKLHGRGVISLGEEISDDNPDLIYYEIE